jgi:hypothetical protein
MSPGLAKLHRNFCVIPAEAGIQYPRAPRFNRQRCGVLDARVRGHDG